MNRKLGLIMTVVVGLFLSACAQKEPPVVDEPVSQPEVAQADDSNAFGTGRSIQELLDLGIDGDPLNYKTVYFEYNRSNIDERSDIIVRAHARELARRGGARVKLDGHADERGTRDYNLALGERRAHAVRDLMGSTGTGGSEVQTVSYGEERPVDTAHNEAAWQKNRRVEISY